MVIYVYIGIGICIHTFISSYVGMNYETSSGRGTARSKQYRLARVMVHGVFFGISQVARMSFLASLVWKATRFLCT